MTYDQKCEELARLFLEDIGDGTFVDQNAAELARLIKRTIEDYTAELFLPTPLRDTLQETKK